MHGEYTHHIIYDKVIAITLPKKRASLLPSSWETLLILGERFLLTATVALWQPLDGRVPRRTETAATVSDWPAQLLLRRRLA